LKDKEDWLRAFKKAKDVQIIERTEKSPMSEVANLFQIGVVPPIWVKDNEQSICSGCKDSFNTFKRRHHCRTCGRIYCNSCCNLYVPVKFDNFKGKQRVCKNCFNLLQPTYLDHLSNLNDENNKLNDRIAAIQENLFTSFNSQSRDDKNENHPYGLSSSKKKKEHNNLDENSKVSRNKTVKSEQSDIDSDELTSTPLTEHQLKIAGEFFKDEHNIEHDDDDDERASETSDDEDDHIGQKPQVPIRSNLINKALSASVDSLRDIKRLDKNESANSSMHPKSAVAALAKATSNLIDLSDKLEKNLQTVSSLSRDTYKANRKLSRDKHKRTNVNKLSQEIEIRNLKVSSTSPNQTVNKPPLSATNSLNLNSKYAFKKEILYSEYGYLCKIPVNQELILLNGNHLKSHEEPSTNTTNEPIKIIPKWERQFFVYYSDHSIGVCPTQCVSCSTFFFFLILFFFEKPISN
jgi:hypothetical protein